jgi:O-antigen/teichoic acid export membrane protein
MEHKPKAFAAIKFVTIAITVVMNILLLVVAKMGVTGIFLSNLIASASAVVMLIPTIRRNFSFDVNKQLLKALLWFGLPFIPAGLATMAVQVIDRPILRALTDDATVGVYQANYRLGIFMMLVVKCTFAWRPFIFPMRAHRTRRNSSHGC